jgi:hypothetical protein
MAQHGYLRDYDEGWGRGGDRERWRDEDGDRKWMLGQDRERGGEHRGAFDRMGDKARRMFGDDDRQHRGDWERSPRKFSSHQDDHYRSWRDQQMEALDRDYEDYCREREQQFHSEFDAWRSQRRGNNPGPLRTGMTQTGQSHDPNGTLELTNEARDNAEPRADPIGAATVGTNSSSE